MPEAALARELALCYTTLALVTDLDAGVEAGEGVTHAEVLASSSPLTCPGCATLLVSTLEPAAGRAGGLQLCGRERLPDSHVLP